VAGGGAKRVESKAGVVGESIKVADCPVKARELQTRDLLEDVIAGEPA
jgi:hypothetical protein